MMGLGNFKPRWLFVGTCVLLVTWITASATLSSLLDPLDGSISSWPDDDRNFRDLTGVGPFLVLRLSIDRVAPDSGVMSGTLGAQIVGMNELRSAISTQKKDNISTFANLVIA
jgi:hypothetical protein